jgi:hypothetical protein
MGLPSLSSHVPNEDPTVFSPTGHDNMARVSKLHFIDSVCACHPSIWNLYQGGASAGSPLTSTFKELRVPGGACPLFRKVMQTHCKGQMGANDLVTFLKSSRCFLYLNFLNNQEIDLIYVHKNHSNNHQQSLLNPLEFVGRRGNWEETRNRLR